MWLVTPTQAWGNQPCVTTLPSLIVMGLPRSSWVKNPPANAGDPGSIPGSGRFPGKGNGNLLQYSCLGNPMDWGACWGTAHGVARIRGDLVTKPPPPLPWGHKGLNTAEQLSMCTHTHTHVLIISSLLLIHFIINYLFTCFTMGVLYFNYINFWTIA